MNKSKYLFWRKSQNYSIFQIHFFFFKWVIKQTILQKYKLLFQDTTNEFHRIIYKRKMYQRVINSGWTKQNKLASCAKEHKMHRIKVSSWAESPSDCLRELADNVLNLPKAFVSPLLNNRHSRQSVKLKSCLFSHVWWTFGELTSLKFILHNIPWLVSLADHRFSLSRHRIRGNGVDAFPQPIGLTNLQYRGEVNTITYYFQKKWSLERKNA